ncbi:MAG TPA: YegS/Rv2252/BmrU family lipid kinase [Candidatus Dormibacteraeota bacterium]|nr:YegS/Rv2252/BmrU family lipid kinase [Candidatus Dormibacteraeota bacterium]
MRAYLAINERSRRGRTLADNVREALAVHGVDVVEGDGALRTGGFDCVIGAGGDGTAAGLIATAIERGVPLGIVPLGTFNELARTLGIPLDIEGAIHLIASGHERRIDIGRVNGAYFVNEASIGISSRITRLQTPELKQRFGFVGVLGTAFQAFRHARPIHVLAYDDRDRCERFRTIQLTIANSHRFGGLVSVEAAAIDDGWLDLYSVEIDTALEAFPIAYAMIQGKPHAVPGLRTLRSARFRIETRHPHHIVADGEPAGFTPALFEVLPKALRVFAPQ